MSRSNLEYARAGLDLLGRGLNPYVIDAMKAHYGEPDWQGIAAQFFYKKHPDHPALKRPPEDWDLAALLSLMLDQWNTVFKKELSNTERSYVNELIGSRNKIAHWESTKVMETRDALRILDTAARLLESIGKFELQAQVEHLQNEINQQVYARQVRNAQQRITRQQNDASSADGLPYMQVLIPWRDVVVPHADVRQGRFNSAEYAADLYNVFRGEANTSEYGRPYDFFNRTYLTGGLKNLLSNALRRIHGVGGDPVINLQTNFGGGKTHSMLALYHLFSGDSSILQTKLVEQLLKENPGLEPRPVKRVVVVGNHLKLTGDEKPDGTFVRTLWGEIAWQLGGPAGYAMVAAADETATNPGQSMQEVLARYSPCLILIDEWVAYARQLRDEQSGKQLVAGDFETQFTFAQTLTEQVKVTPGVLLVISLPESNNDDNREVGGEKGQQALVRLANIVGRVESPWRPATTEESYGIVTSRLFEPISPDKRAKRDAILREIQKYYKEHEHDFPDRVSSEEYYERMQRTYPIHPELFEYLSNRWASLPTFQRTRGILRLLSKVISEQWEAGSREPLLMPANISLDDSSPVQQEFTRHLSSNWLSVLSTDVEGLQSLPRNLDANNKRLGASKLHLRVARALFMATAPLAESANRGVDVSRVRLATLLLPERPHQVDEALMGLVYRATYLYSSQNRYWYSTQPNINSLAAERRNNYLKEPEELRPKLKKALEAEMNDKRFIRTICIMPAKTDDVFDALKAQLVILEPQASHVKQSKDTPAVTQAKHILEECGSRPRIYRNALIFLAADQSRVDELLHKAAELMAWTSIRDDHECERLILDRDQRTQVEEQLKQSQSRLQAILREAYRWLLEPKQPDPKTSQIVWEAHEIKAPKQNRLIDIVEAEIRAFGMIVPAIAPNMLRSELLDQFYFNKEDQNHFELRTLAQHMYRYTYNLRLTEPEVLYKAVAEGPGRLDWAESTFAWASSFDLETGEYRDLRAGQAPPPECLRGEGLLVKPEVALKQLEAERARRNESVPEPTPTSVPVVAESVGTHAAARIAAPPPAPTKTVEEFRGEISVKGDEFARKAAKIQEEIIDNMIRYGSKNVQVRIVLEATVPANIDTNYKRVIRENAWALGLNYQYE